jgi:predicted NBD/HSP70 family sugar kinase
MQKISTMQTSEENILNGQLTIGLDLGDRFSSYCILDEVGKILREQKVPTTPEEMKQTFGRMVRSRIAMETGTHSPWVSRLLTGLGHEVIVALCGVAAWAEGLWRERATDAHQQRGRRVFTEAAGAGGALHFGTLWGR